MKLLVLTAILILLLAPSFASASSVIRSLPDSAYPGQNINVTLDVSVTGGETYYLIDESVPPGWALLSQAPDTEPGHMKWAVIQNAAGTSYAYEVRAPQSEGTYTFSGSYIFEGMKSEGSIGGTQAITVRAAASSLGYENLVIIAIIITTIAISAAIYLLKSR